MGRIRIRRIPMIIVFLLLLVTLTPLSFENTIDGVEPEGTYSIVEDVKPEFNSFIENRGQLDREDIRYYTTGIAKVGFTADRIVFVISGDGSESLLYEVRFRDCNPTTPEGIKPCSGVYNYLIGNREDWRTDVPHYSEVVYADLWDGIDMRYHISGGFLKYDLILHPGADPNDISMTYAGIELVSVQNNGDLLIDTSLGQVRDKGLVAYQDGKEIPVEFLISRGNTVSFDVGYYNKDKTLIIDPLLQFSSYLPITDVVIVVENLGSNDDDIYIAGRTDSINFQTILGASNTTVVKGGAFVRRMKSDLSGFVFSTLVGGSGDDQLRDMVVDDEGNIYIGGETSSMDYPTTPGALNETSNIWIKPDPPYPDVTYFDIFLTKLNPNGTDLIYSTFLGGHGGEGIEQIVVDSSGNLYAWGNVISTDFPLVNAYQDTLQGHINQFILKLNPQGSKLIYSTIFGFNDTWKFGPGGLDRDKDNILCIAVDDVGRLVICGITDDEDLPITTGAYNSKYVNDMGYLAMLYPNGSGLEFCTFLWEGIFPYHIVLDNLDEILISGLIKSDSLDYTLNAVDKTFNGSSDGFVASMDFNGTTLKYATYLGGDDWDYVGDMDVDSSGNIWIAGQTESTDFPVTNDAFRDQISGEQDAFASCLSGDLSTLVFSTYFGGSESDFAKNIIVLNMNEFYIAGGTSSTDFPITPGAIEKNFSSPSRSYISKIKVNSNIPSSPSKPFIVEGDQFINISWIEPEISGNEKILNFSVYRSMNNDDYTIAMVVDGEITWFNDTGLRNGYTYYYRVTASNIVGESPASPIISGIPSAFPGSPVIEIHDKGDSFVNITWTDPEDDGGREIIGYNVYIGSSGDDLSSFYTTDRRWFNFTDLVNGNTYFIAVSASNIFGEGVLSNILTIIPMSRSSQPQNLRALIGEGFVHLYWDRPEDDGGDPLITYVVFVSEDNITFDLVDEGIETEEYNVTPFPSNEIKLFHVRAQNTMGLSSPSNVVFSKKIRPSAPTDFIVRMEDSSAFLIWGRPKYGGVDSITYTVYYGIGPDLMEVYRSKISSNSIYIEKLINGVSYYFAVCAVDPKGEGPWTDTIHGIPFGIPSKPTDLTVEPIDSGMILRWGTPDDFGGWVGISYVVYSGTNSDSQAEIGSTNSTMYSLSGLENGEVYYFRVRARNDKINGELSDLVSGIPMGVPGSPINIMVTPGDGSILISWDEPDDNGGSVSLRYRVVITRMSSDTSLSYDDLNNKSFEINGLINGEEYSVLVLTKNIMGVSIPSDIVYTIPRGAPGPPTSFSLVQNDMNVELSWLKPGSDGGSEITGYRIYRGTSLDDLRLLTELGSDVYLFVDENTLKGVTYHYRINAYNNVGEGESTSTISIEIVDSSDTRSNDVIIVTFIMGLFIILLLTVLAYLMFVRRSEKIPGYTDEKGPIGDQERDAPTPIRIEPESNMTDEIEE